MISSGGHNSQPRQLLHINYQLGTSDLAQPMPEQKGGMTQSQAIVDATRSNMHKYTQPRQTMKQQCCQGTAEVKTESSVPRADSPQAQTEPASV
jgi:hypothetical protein